LQNRQPQSAANRLSKAGEADRQTTKDDGLPHTTAAGDTGRNPPERLSIWYNGFCRRRVYDRPIKACR